MKKNEISFFDSIALSCMLTISLAMAIAHPFFKVNSIDKEAMDHAVGNAIDSIVSDTVPAADVTRRIACFSAYEKTQFAARLLVLDENPPVSALARKKIAVAQQIMTP